MVTRTQLSHAALGLLASALSVLSYARGASGEEGGGAVEDSCSSATVLSVSVGEPVVEIGSLAGATDDLTAWCSDPEGGRAEVVYRADIAEDCSASFRVEGEEGLDVGLGLRTIDCRTDEYCSDGPDRGERIDASLSAGSYWVVVTGGAASSGAFTLTIECAAPECGNGWLDPGEQCDDFNTLAGDGCDPDCNVEPADPALDTCAAASASEGVLIGAGEVLHIAGTTLGASDSGTGSCMIQPDGETFFGAPDNVYHVRPTADGLLSATVGLDAADDPFCGSDEVEPSMPYPFGCYDRAVHIRSGTCDDPSAEIGCSDDWQGWWPTEEAAVSVTAGTDYYVFVDGYNDDPWGAGPYVLRLELEGS